MLRLLRIMAVLLSYFSFSTEATHEKIDIDGFYVLFILEIPSEKLETVSALLKLISQESPYCADFFSEMEWYRIIMTNAAEAQKLKLLLENEGCIIEMVQTD